MKHHQCLQLLLLVQFNDIFTYLKSIKSFLNIIKEFLDVRLIVQLCHNFECAKGGCSDKCVVFWLLFADSLESLLPTLRKEPSYDLYLYM